METIKDIVKQMRYGVIPKHRHDHELLKFFADRIEEAVTNCHAFKTRKALELAVRLLKDATESDEYGDDAIYLVGCMRTVMKACSTALKEPVRNCDLYASVDDAWTAFCKDDPPHLMYSPWLDSLVKFRDWLFEEAKELK